MAFSNSMTRILNIIEVRLGVKLLNLPDQLKKDTWAEWIYTTTLTTFSTFYPNVIPYTFNTDEMKRDAEGYYLIDESKFPSEIEILGAQDIPWTDPHAFGVNGYGMSGFNQICTTPYGVLDSLQQYNYGDIAAIQAGADYQSLFASGIYLDFKPPNRIKLNDVSGCYNDFRMRTFKVNLLIKHAKNLQTIEPTKMRIFEDLATCDVAEYLYSNLKFYDEIDTVFANTSLRLDDLKAWADRRQEIIDKLEENYVAADNFNQPLWYTIN